MQLFHSEGQIGIRERYRFSTELLFSHWNRASNSLSYQYAFSNQFLGQVIVQFNAQQKDLHITQVTGSVNCWRQKRRFPFVNFSLMSSLYLGSLSLHIWLFLKQFVSVAPPPHPLPEFIDVSTAPTNSLDFMPLVNP